MLSPFTRNLHQVRKYRLYTLYIDHRLQNMYPLYTSQFVPPEWICRSGGDGSLFGAFRALASNVHLLLCNGGIVELYYSTTG